MPQLDLTDYKRAIADLYNRRSQTYDDSALHAQICQRLLEFAQVSHQQHILDIATGTGHVAIASAQIVGNQGRVVGVDIALQMLERARDKVKALSLTNIEFMLADAEALHFPANSFDRILCANAFPWFENKQVALRQWLRFLKPGGLIAIHTPADTAYVEHTVLRKVFAKYGVTLAPSNRIGTIDACRNLFVDAGFEEIKIETAQHGSFISLDKAKASWEQIYFRLFPEASENPFAISAAQLAQAKNQFTAELAALHTAQGIWDDLTTWYILGCKPNSSLTQ